MKYRTLLLALAFMAPLAGAQQSATVTGFTRFGRKPLADVTITLVEAQLTVRSDRDGAFTFPSVVPGTYTLRAERSGYAPLSQSITVDPARSDTLIVTMGIDYGRMRRSAPPPKIIPPHDSGEKRGIIPGGALPADRRESPAAPESDRPRRPR